MVRGTWYETERGLVLVGMDLKSAHTPCGLTERAHMQSSGSNHFERDKVSSHCFTLTKVVQTGVG